MKKYYQKNKIKSPKKGRRFVIGDIHGCYHTFKTLVEKKIQIQKKDQLFLLGDYIDKGPESKKTLDYIIKLIKNNFRIYPLRGNHEQALLDIQNNKNVTKWWISRNPKMFKEGELRKKYVDFLNHLPFYYELDHFFLVHACFNFKAKDPLKDKTSILWGRNFDYNKKILKNKTLIHGHQPLYIEDIIKSVNNRKKVIGLDNGVIYSKYNKSFDHQKFGNLCALNLDTYELLVQKNCEKTAILDKSLNLGSNHSY